MSLYVTHFISLFATLLAIINPLEAIPVFLLMLAGKDAAVHRSVAIKSCLYAFLLMVFFLLFGTLLLHLFGVSIAMVQVVGGIIMTKIGFELFAPTGRGIIPSAGSQQPDGMDVAFVPLAMPIMFGPGGIATLIGMAATMHLAVSSVPIYASSLLAVASVMGVTCLSLIYAQPILRKLGPRGIDAATRVIGFFVSAMGMGMVFSGVVAFLQSYGVLAAKVATAAS